MSAAPDLNAPGNRFEKRNNTMPGLSHHLPAEKLRFFSSPLARRAGDSDSQGQTGAYASDHKHDECKHPRSPADELPELKKHDGPTLLELFFDLFFAANYNAFSDTQKVTNHARFKAYVGYFCLLWLTWFLVTLFDVRYVTDSIFSRLTRAIQLGVLVGFVVVAPKFDPSDQHSDTMRAMSIILAVSRACLAVEYGATLWHLRKFKRARLPIYTQIGLHIVSSLVYLGVAFCFRNNNRSPVYMVWYFFSGAEAIGSLLISNFSPVTSLTKTHLMKRITLLTVMIMGDGIIQLAKEVVIIVRNLEAWDSTTIGLVTAATTTIYFLFLIYFDWMRSGYYLPALRQQLWASFHLPLHLALVLHLQSFTQWLIWSTIWNQIRRLTDFADPSEDAFLFNTTSIAVRDSINASVQAFLRDYPPKALETVETINDALRNLTTIPDSFWSSLAKYSASGDFEGDISRTSNVQGFGTFVDSIFYLVTTLGNVLFQSFGIEIQGELTAQKSKTQENLKGGALQFKVHEKTWSRCRLVFAYGYISAGSTVALMATLAIIARTAPFKTWPIVRIVLVYLLALGTCLTALLWYDEEKSEAFLSGPWVLPTITFVWSLVLMVTHINGERGRRLANRFNLC
ncbi:Low temperature requirement A [Hirsutella rhossiliensis]|uniref:Low temperature requirement A n=1 Tax=Hirsutella rhossiliensis TaxID=111463 RepID=A0A9P8SLC9_9HYPO|nr:Low temperature requirement A [Hirsutella rhossiliensis]KAH0966124.1 Low temperature requirement A [Hirsutella rhossiliensis]